MSDAFMRAFNYAVEYCEDCCGPNPVPHRHGPLVHVPTEHPEQRTYGCTPERPNFMHAVGMDRAGRYTCSCEHGQKKARRIKWGEILDDCCHVCWRDVLDRLGIDRALDYKRTGGRVAVIVGGNGEEL